MIYKVELKERIDNSILESLKLASEEKEGIADLLNELIMLGRCETYNQDRAIYVSSILQKENVDFTFRTIY